jgi:hypothetical protein
MSRTKIKPKASVKSVMRDSNKMLDELNGINSKLKGANNQLIQTHMATHAWVKSLEERITKLEDHIGIAPQELPVEPLADGALEGPGVEVLPSGEGSHVVLNSQSVVPTE